MADDPVAIPDYSDVSRSIAADLDGSNNYHQYVKLECGADGTFTKVPSVTAADGLANQTTFPVVSLNHVWNGSTWDRERGPYIETLLAGANRTGTTATGIITQYGMKGVQLLLHIVTTPNNAETLSWYFYFAHGGNLIDGFLINSWTASVLGAAPNLAYGLIIYPGAVETIAMTNMLVQALAIGRNVYSTLVHSGGGTWNYALYASWIK